jgi:hypothetical protein
MQIFGYGMLTPPPPNFSTRTYLFFDIQNIFLRDATEVVFNTRLSSDVYVVIRVYLFWKIKHIAPPTMPQHVGFLHFLNFRLRQRKTILEHVSSLVNDIQHFQVNVWKKKWPNWVISTSPND